MPIKMWNKITYPFPNFHGATVEVWEFDPHIIRYNYLSMLELKLNHVSKRDPLGDVINFNHGVLGLAENPARGTGFWSQNTEGVL